MKMDRRLDVERVIPAVAFKPGGIDGGVGFHAVTDQFERPLLFRVQTPGRLKQNTLVRRLYYEETDRIDDLTWIRKG